MVSSVVEQDPRLFKERTPETPEEKSVPQEMHAQGVALAFSMENALFASVLGKQQEDAPILQAAGIDPSQLTIDYVAGFAQVMTEWAAEVAAASLPNPEKLSVPQLPTDSFLAHIHPPLFRELAREIAGGVKRGIASAPQVRQALAQDPTGLTYIQNHLKEEETRPLPLTQSSHTRNAELQGMAKALQILEGISQNPTNSAHNPTRKR